MNAGNGHVAAQSILVVFLHNFNMLVWKSSSSKSRNLDIFLCKSHEFQYENDQCKFCLTTVLC